VWSSQDSFNPRGFEIPEPRGLVYLERISMFTKQAEITNHNLHSESNKEMFAMNKFHLFVVLLALGILTSACASGDMSTEWETNPGIDSASYEADYDADDFSGEMSAGNIYGSSQASITQRIVIRNAYLSLVVSDPAESSDRIAAMSEEMGGFVVDLNVSQTTFESGIEGESASITIRVPVDQLDEALETIKDLAIEIRYEEITGEDVTEEYTDLQSRLRHLEAIEEQLLGFLEEADDTEDALDVFDQLERKQSEIEVTKGRIKYLEESASLSRISIDLQPDFVEKPLQIGNWRPVGTAKDAIEALVGTLQGIGDVIIVMCLYILPVMLVLGITTWPLRKLYRHFWPKKEKAPAEEE
jgi:hypothetical protein